jgi:hypothetical protein
MPYHTISSGCRPHSITRTIAIDPSSLLRNRRRLSLHAMQIWESQMHAPNECFVDFHLDEDDISGILLGWVGLLILK